MSIPLPTSIAAPSCWPWPALAGWACGLTLNLPDTLVLDMAAIVAGGVIVNAAIAELPKEREASYWSFVTGAVIYTGLLLVLSHFESH